MIVRRSVIPQVAILAAIIPALALAIIPSCTPGGERDNTERHKSKEIYISKDDIRAHIQFLASDLLEGRAPGTRGGRLAEEYVQSVFRMYGFEPYYGADGYFQEFTLKGYSLTELAVKSAGVVLRLGDDVVGSFPRDVESFSLTADAVFCGYGIKSDAWSWDDYKDTDVTGKVVIVRVNEPGRTDPELFEGGALTYFGRWDYKINEAALRGAKAILLVHTTETAGYGWHVVQNSWSGEELYLPSDLENDLSFRGWIREERLREIFIKKGIDLDELYERSETRGFRPVDLELQISAEGRNSYRSFTTRNVVGLIPGSDSAYKDRAILLSAHIDHLGMNEDLPGEDKIFNGAIDNGSAVAAMLATAKALAERSEELKYSVIILACQAEESGLLGSYHFALSLDPKRIVCNINYESTPVWERTGDIFALGAKYSSLESIMHKVLAEQGLEYTYFSMYEQGFYYRSDQFSFARRGIPSIWLSAGDEYESGANH
ncbi:MAG: M28 family peptidase, partial [Candidatus Krumholzibacteria bacterium]|nr:M28 family peptidase [Candidatus Krumholzibacteria bacterium]